MKRIACLTIMCLMLVGHSYSQTECSGQNPPLQTVLQARDTSGTVHQLLCFNSSNGLMQLPGVSGTFTAASFSGVLTILAGGAINNNTTLIAATAPSIAAGGCGGAAAGLVTNNGTAAFTFQVGTTPTNSCTITLPTATHGWWCNMNDTTNPTTGGGYYIKTTAFTTTTSVLTFYNTSGAATAPTASDNISGGCFGF